MNVKITDYPYRYKAFALNVFSDIPITGLSSTDALEGDILITTGCVPEKLEKPLNNGVLFQAGENSFLLHIQNLASFFVQNGNSITVEYKNGTEHEDISVFLMGTVFGALLHQRRLLPLHGSTVFYQNKCIVFSGLSGSGKSTIAGALLEKGAQLVADDISVIVFSSDIPEVAPSFPGIKIWEDSLRILGKKPEKFRPIRKELKKYLIPVENYTQSNIPLDHIFILGTHNKDEFAVNNITGIDKFNCLKNNTYLFRGMNRTGIVQKHFELCNRLAQAIPVTQITRPNSGFRIKELIGCVENCL